MQDVARFHIGDKTALFFVESPQRAALSRDQPHSQPRPIPVSPRWSVNRPVNRFRMKLADVLEVVLEDALLDGNLRPYIEVLHGAAAAFTEIGAFRPRAHDAFTQDF